MAARRSSSASWWPSVQTNDRSEWDAFLAEEKASANVFELKVQHPPKESEKSKLEAKFVEQAAQHGLPKFARDHHFAKQIGRQWKFDFAFLDYRLAVEVEGIVMRRDKAGNWQMGGRHANIAGFEEDCVKYAAAALLGWTVLRFSGGQVKKKFAVGMTLRVLHARGWRPAGDTEVKRG